MRKIILCQVLILTCVISMAQQGTVKGKIMDTLEKKPLALAVVSLLQASDSTLYKFKRTDSTGSFLFTNVRLGKYILLVNYPEFVDYVDPITVPDSSSVQIDKISLSRVSILLNAVIIRTNRTIRIKGDTTEYLADSFALKKDATVEDLLKVLPGFQVNSNGQIIIHGKNVDRVLVDGEEFFGNDPTIATQNLAARIVDKVQVYDTKSEQESIKGIGSAQEGKTVNIKLKDDRKKGSFGKAEAGTNFSDITNSKLMYNQFIGNRKVSVYATKSNTSTGTLDFIDRRKLGVESNQDYDEINGYYLVIGMSDIDFSQYMLRGLPDAYSAGGFFSNKWDQGNQNLYGSYLYNRLGTVNQTLVNTQNILPDRIFYTKKQIDSKSLLQKHTLDAKFEWRPDSLTTIKFLTSAADRISDITSTSFNQSISADSTFLNAATIHMNDHIRRELSDNQLSYKRLFKKPGRLILASFRLGSTGDEEQNTLHSLTELTTSSGFLTDTIDQYKQVKGSSLTLGLKCTYLEPLNTNWSLILDYGFNQNKSYSYRHTFDKAITGKYDRLDSLYSNDFSLKAYNHNLEALLKYTGKKLKFVFGSGVSSIHLNILNHYINQNFNYPFLKFAPQAQFNYSLRNQKSVIFTYKGSTLEPTIDQLQPIRVNNDPLNIYIGNPYLQVGFEHNLSLTYSGFKPISSTYFYIGSAFNFDQNGIGHSSTIDSSGRKLFMPVNVQGIYNWQLNINFNHGQKPITINYSFSASANGGQNRNLINNTLASISYLSFGIRPGIRYLDPEKLVLNASVSAGYNFTNTRIIQKVHNSYFTVGGHIDGFYPLPWDLELSSTLDLDFRQKTALFNTHVNLIIWGTSIGKPIFKNKSGKIILEGEDLLNQNKGIVRIINSSFVSEESYLRRSRYFLLKFQWSFDKMPSK